MNGVQVLALLVLLSGVAQATRFVIVNRLGYTIWVGSLGNPGKPQIKNGGWEMRPGTQTTVEVPDNWAGRFWGRTGCKFDRSGKGRCDTGDCDNGLQCRGKTGKPPATLAEITLKGDKGQDFYDVSLVDGFNVPASITPLNKRSGGSRYRCKSTACRVNINQLCPKSLRLVKGGRVVGCKSACEAFVTSDEYCCRGRYNTPATCKSTRWPVNYPAFFKQHCPDAYSYAYDDKKSTFTCEQTGYKIQFG